MNFAFGMNLRSSVTVPQWMLLFPFFLPASVITRGRVDAYLYAPFTWSVTLYVVSSLIGLAIVTFISLTVTKVAITFEIRNSFAIIISL